MIGASGEGRDQEATSWILLGGASPLRRAIAAQLLQRGERVIVVDDRSPENAEAADRRISWLTYDVLLEDVNLPPGRLVLLPGTDDADTPRPWSTPYRIALPIARLLPHLHDRDVTFLSSASVYGTGEGPVTEESPTRLPIQASAIDKWCVRALRAAEEPCPPWRAAPLCQELVSVEDSERWAGPLSYRAAERILELGQASMIATRVLRLGEVLGLGHTGQVAAAVRRIRNGQPLQADVPFHGVVPLIDVALAVTAHFSAGVYNLTDMSLSLAEITQVLMDELGRTESIKRSDRTANWPNIDSSRIRRLLPDWPGLEPALVNFARESYRSPPIFMPPIEVVTPPRPENPAIIAQRQGQVYTSGRLKSGNRWTRELTARLSEMLDLDNDRTLVLTSSGTAALRLAVLAATQGKPQPSRAAVLPAFTFPATGEFLRQLGYELIYCDIDARTWTLSAPALRRILASRSASLVVSVDALGNPADYDEVRQVCRSAGVPLVADSAPSLGARYRGSPVGCQADAHAFSMSFAKVVSAAGAGGFAIVPADADLTTAGNWLRSSMMPEVNAIVALDQLDHLDHLLQRRRAVAAVYEQYALPTTALIPQHVRSGNAHSFVHWVARVRPPYQRDDIARRLELLGVLTKPYYSPSLHHQLSGSVPDKLTETADVVREVLALPTSSEMSVHDAERVVSAFKWVIAELDH